MKLLSSFSIIIFLLCVSCTNFKDLGKEFIQQDDFVPPPDMEFYGFRRENYDTNFKQLDSFATNAKFYNKTKIRKIYFRKRKTIC